MTYIHPNDNAIREFIENNIYDKSSLQAVCKELLLWFDKNVSYSRLNAPFFPLQRSDLDVLAMRSGTCGDYSNLIVSVLLQLGHEAAYAYVHTDCYGDAQDHICAAARENGEWILIDATQPYRKWYGFRCPHRDYELLSPEDFEARMKKEETYWTDVALRYGNELYAGLLYAPWIHEETLRETDDLQEKVFFLLMLDKQKKATLYTYDQRYTKEGGAMPIMGVLTEGKQTYCFSCKKPNGIWDNDQWSREYTEEEIPDEFQAEALSEFKQCISKISIQIMNQILPVLKESACE